MIKSISEFIKNSLFKRKMVKYCSPSTSKLTSQLKEKYYLKAQNQEQYNYKSAKSMRAALYAIERVLRKLDKQACLKADRERVEQEALEEFFRNNSDDDGYGKDLIHCYLRDFYSKLEK